MEKNREKDGKGKKDKDAPKQGDPQQGTPKEATSQKDKDENKTFHIHIPKSLNWVFHDSCIELEVEKKYSQFADLITQLVDTKEQTKDFLEKDENWKNATNIEGVASFADRYIDFWDFYFKLKRLQDEETNEEILIISCLERTSQGTEKPHGVIRTNLLDLQSDIKEFLRYGVALQDVEFFAIASLIRREYMKIELETVENEIKNGKEKLIKSILNSLAEYLRYNHIEKRNDLYYISVVDFNNLLSQVDIKKYQFQAVRKMLVEEKYIKRGTNEISVTFRSKDKQVYRALAFDAEQVEKFFKDNGIGFPPVTEKKKESGEQDKK